MIVLRLIFVFLFSSALAADVDFERSFSELGYLDHPMQRYLEKNKRNLNEPISKYLDDEDVRFRKGFYVTLWQMIDKAEQISEASDLTKIFVMGINDKRTQSYVLRRLSLPPFTNEHFSEQSREVIRSYDVENGKLFEFIRVLGVVGEEHSDIDLLEYTKKSELFEDGRANAMVESTNLSDFLFFKSNSWSSLLALARNGDESFADRVLNEVKRINRNDLVAYPNIVEDLGYLLSSNATDLLVDLLFSEIPPPEYRTHGDSKITPLSYHAIRGLARSLYDFPIHYWQPITEKELDKARKFIRDYEGPWKIKGKWNPQEQSIQVVQEAEKESSVEVTEIKSTEEATTEESKQEELPEPLEVVEEQNESSKWLFVVIALIGVIGLIAIVSRKKK